MGSGTTAVVAVRQRRRFVGIEIDTVWVDTALERLREELKKNRKLGQANGRKKLVAIG